MSWEALAARGYVAAIDALAAWDARPEAADLQALRTGHVNASFFARLGDGRMGLLQRISRRAFRDPHALMRNVVRVIDHLSGAHPEAIWPELCATADGARWIEREGEVWRLYRWIPGCHSLAQPDSPQRARLAAGAFGGFVAALRRLPPSLLELHLPGFHDMALRRTELASAQAAAEPARRAGARELEERLRDLPAAAPLGGRARVVHGDTKLSNVLFSVTEQRPVTVIDLDTVMPGPLAWDFGDLMRSVASAAPEDEPDVARVRVDDAAVAAVADAYARSAAEVMERAEIPELARAPAHMAGMLATRFLADHLRGDRYFRITRPMHNLDRARTQLRLAELLALRQAGIAERLEQALG